MDERIKQIEMVVSDLDDTLVRSDKRISDDTKRVFGECVKRGIRTAFATARLAVSTLLEEQELKPNIRIVSNGGMVLEGGKVVLFHAMDGKELGRFLHRLIQLKAQGIYVGCREQVYTNSESFRCSRTLKQSVYCDLQEPIKEEACQVFFRIREREKAEELQKEFSFFSWVCYRDGTYAVMAPGVSKAKALLEIAYRYGISPDRIAAFGDDEGDLEMLQVCGVGVAMGNALPYVKAGAAYVTKSNEEDGVAWFIDRYILGKGEKRDGQNDHNGS